MVNWGVPKKRKKKFTAAKAVKSMARAAIGAPRPVERQESRKRTERLKHKPTFGKLLAESEGG